MVDRLDVIRDLSNYGSDKPSERSRDRHDGDMHNFERLRGFGDRQTDRQMDICDSRVAFATEISKDKNENRLCSFVRENFNQVY